ncbi:hypothetical protein PR202_ga18048 [Eleusine coracana subsp. coracana]|uniref:non-specific serine/threonine protein kinase n=1 Tax=Eleusine coracana subsp. coracana TaxID=191504 RepID=A0AAV5CRP9_ELECO|nr:hypothetical protein PR202_ga18048 [Eleusine coracana subsp. coracana]
MAVRGVFSFTVTLFSFLLASSIARANEQSYLVRGSSISTQDDTTTILVSPNGTFSCGFYKVATNAFTFSIWFSRSSDKTVAWTANRDNPVNGKGSKFTFQKNGGLELTDYNGMAVWSTNTTATHADRVMLLDKGDLVVMDQQGQILWSSFDFPTDTLLPCQKMTWNTKLKGQFEASDQFGFQASDLGDEVMRRLTLDYDGNLRLYSLNISSGHWRMCLDKQDCQAFGYRKGPGKCYPKVLLFNGKKFPDPCIDIYLKVPEGTLSLVEMSPGQSMDCKVTEIEAYPSSQLLEGGPSGFQFGYFLSSALTLLVIEVLVDEGEGEMEMAVRHSAEILKKKLASEDQSWLLDVVDYRLNGDLNYSQAAMMVKIAVSCVEEDRTRRPTMSLVVETLLSVME